MAPRYLKLLSYITKDVLEASSYIVVILGIPLFFVQQWEQGNTRKSENTLEYIRLFQSDRVVAAREKLLSSWFDYRDQLGAMNGISDKMFNRLVASMIDVSVEKDKENNLRWALFAINDFYNQLDLCISKSTCDEAMATSYFAQEAKEVQELYGPWFASNRRMLHIPDFGGGIEKISVMTAARP